LDIYHITENKPLFYDQCKSLVLLSIM